jgi:hypothetical protein
LTTPSSPLPPPPPRCQVLRHLPEKQRYTLELLEPTAGGGGVGKRMDVRPANFVLAHLPAGTRCARARRLHGSRHCSPVFVESALNGLYSRDTNGPC